MLTLEQIILRRGDIEKIYRADVTLTLWRALRTDEAGGANPLYPDLEPRTLPNGDIREPDVSKYVDASTGQTKVRAEEGRGTSVTDAPGIFGFRHWEYIVIPKGTKIPHALIITKDHYIARKKCWHYSISPNEDMEVGAFLRALDELAINAGISLRVQRRA